MEFIRKSWRRTPVTVRRILVAIIGTLVLIAGLIMLVTPGPGLVIIFIALAIFASEFQIANRAHQKLSKRFQDAAEAAKRRLKR